MCERNKRVCVFMQVYRNESSLHKAIDSVLSQTYGNFRFCVLVSPETKSIVEKYAVKDPRIEIYDGIIGESNFDYYSRWQSFLQRGGEEYFTVIDADDWYDKYYIEELLCFAEKYQTDITACGSYFVDSSERIVGVRQQYDLIWTTVDTAQIFPNVYAFFRTIWGKLMTSDLILNQKMESIPNRWEYGGYGGDTLYMFNLLPLSHKIGICNKKLYYYRLSASGSSYILRDGRLDSDACLFHYVKNVLKSWGPVGELPERFLYLVYGNALKDTTVLLLKQNLQMYELAEKLFYIFSNELTINLCHRERRGALNITEQAPSPSFIHDYYELIFADIKRRALTEAIVKKYLSIFEILYVKWTEMFSVQEFSVLVVRKELLDALIEEKYEKVFSLMLEQLRKAKPGEIEIYLRLLRRVSKTEALKPVLTEQKFVLKYADLLNKINQRKEDEAFLMLRTMFSKDRAPYNGELLIKLWTDLAALRENAAEFILGKEYEVDMLLKKRKLDEAKACYKELDHIGIQDEMMSYLYNQIVDI